MRLVCRRYCAFFTPIEKASRQDLSPQTERNPMEDREKPIDWTKPLETASGKPILYYEFRQNGSYPFKAFIEARVDPKSYTVDGDCYSVHFNSPFDLINVPEPKVANPISNEQMPWMLGRIIVSKASMIRSIVVSVNVNANTIETANDVSIGSTELMDRYIWSDGEPISSRYPPKRIDFSDQHEVIEP